VVSRIINFRIKEFKFQIRQNFKVFFPAVRKREENLLGFLMAILIIIKEILIKKKNFQKTVKHKVI
jgi:hypothetical protein